MQQHECMTQVWYPFTRPWFFRPARRKRAVYALVNEHFQRNRREYQAMGERIPGLMLVFHVGRAYGSVGRC